MGLYATGVQVHNQEQDMKQRRQATVPASNSKPQEPAKLGTTPPVPLDGTALKQVAGGNSLPVKGW
jgi:hypothetical protein